MQAITGEKIRQIKWAFASGIKCITCLSVCLCLPLSSAFPSPLHPLSSSLPPSPAPEQADTTTTVTGDGMAAFTGDIAAAQEEAVWDAKRNAVEQAVGIFLKARTLGTGFSVQDDELQARTQGFVRKWEIVEGSRRIETVTHEGKTSRILHIQVQATVGLQTLVQRLADIADVYKDLERPRVRVIITPLIKKNQPAKNEAAKSETTKSVTTPEAALRLQNALGGALKAQGFDVAEEGAAEVVLTGTLEIIPTVRIGDASAPYGVGDMVAACRARLVLQAVSTSGEDVLFVRRAEAAGRSFQSDADAQDDALTRLSQDVLGDSEARFVPQLLARWARERQEGHVVVVHVEGLDSAGREQLKQTLADMRGFRHWTDEQQDAHRVTLRFLTRRDTRSVRRDLAALALNPTHSADTAQSAASKTLLVLNDRGPIIECAARIRVPAHR